MECKGMKEWKIWKYSCAWIPKFNNYLEIEIAYPTLLLMVDVGVRDKWWTPVCLMKNVDAKIWFTKRKILWL